MVERRRPIKLLPPVNQTETLTKFFAATVDHLFQPESVEFVSAYIGSKPSYYNSATDFYVGEPTKSRQDYQLPATAVSKNPNSGVLTNIMFYDDFVNVLKFHGANTQNHSRLFDQEYYSWSPPIDLDKILNYTKYYWAPTGPAPIKLLTKTDAVTNIIGSAQYTYTGTYQLTSTGEIINGTIDFTTGLIVMLVDDATETLNNVPLYINNVGKAIQLITPPPGNSVLAEIKDYTTLGVSSNPTNAWSANNCWYHEDVFAISKTVISNSFQYRAARPIIEFEADLQLYNNGWNGKSAVTVISTASNVYEVVGTTLVKIDSTNINNIVGKAVIKIDNVLLKDGDTILVTENTDVTTNGIVFEVTGLDLYGAIALTAVSSVPVLGDTRTCTSGAVYSNTQVWYNGTQWVIAQQRVPYVPPLFVLYDSDGNSLNDPSVYPGSTFAGNAIFTYATDQYAAVDSELGIKPKTNQYGNYVFDNAMVSTAYTYQYNTVITNIEGYYYYLNRANGTDTYDNAWYKAPTLSRQYIVNDFAIVTKTSTFTIDQTPDQNPGVIPSIYVTLIKNEIATLLKNGIDYTVLGRIVTLVTPASAGDRIIIRSWSKGVPEGASGYYELPLNLTANPDNLQISSIAQSQYLSQFEEIIANQPGFKGSAVGNNNWRDTPKIRGVGFSILQHRAPMLKPMILSSGNVTVGINTVQSDTDPMLAMQFTQREYLRFYNRFVSALFTLNANGYTLNQSPDVWVSTALKQINLGKTPASAFANSGPSTTQGAYCDSKSDNPTYVPPTATRLGCAPAYLPTVYLDNDNLVIQCHDGARIVMAKDGLPLGGIANGLTSTISPALLTNPVAAAWLQFEIDLYLNLPSRYRDPQATLALDIRDYTPGKWRQGAYTPAEFEKILSPMFDKWVITNQVDYRANTTYDANDPFTWNYHTSVDQNGMPVPGYYQGIYRWFYDTDRPHSHPWEMLGFTQEPSWWTVEYGAAPYTAGNMVMWEDLRDGYIRQGPRAGYHTVWARPGLMSCIPVDDQGNLLPPLAAGTVATLPGNQQAQAEWVFGDGSPIESVWIYSNDYNFAIAEYSYLMKPAQFIEYNWDTIRSKHVFEDQVTSQWVYIDTNDRRPNGQFYVQRENPLAIGGNINVPNESTLSYFGSCGVQHWISEYLISRNLSVTQYFGNIIRGTNVQLAHQMGSFVGSNLYLTADSFGQIGYKSQIVPNENVRTYLYKSASIKTAFYGGVIITQLRNGYRVVGYDGVKQYFDIIPSNAFGPKSYVVVGNERIVWFKQGLNTVQQVPYGYVFGTKQEVFDFLIGLQRAQEADGWVFDTYNADGNYVYDWQQSGKEFLFWSQGNWANGNFIALSPLANSAKFLQRFGNIQFVNGIVGGTYPLLDKTGSPIQGQNVEVLRYDDEIVVAATNIQNIYGLRLFATTLESVVVIDNQTAFGDIIYDPLYNQAQPRLKLYAYRTNDWNGRVDAPGYFLYQDGTDNQWNLVPNFEKTANDFRKYFNIEQPKNYVTVDPISGNLVQASTTLAVIDNQPISEISKHLIGYQQRGYLQNLLLEDSTEFQFYQGFIRQKGTRGAIDKILRNDSIIPVTSDFVYYEEYALRIARFGDTALNIGIDFVIPQSLYVNDPQQITVYGTEGTDRDLDGIIVLIPNDPRIVVQPQSYSSVTNPLFPERQQTDANNPYDYPTTGYVLIGETDYTVTNTAALTSLFSTQLESNVRLKDGDTVWQFIDDQNSWTVWQYSKANVNIANTSPSIFSNAETTIINTTGNVGVTPGDIIVLTGVSNVNALEGTWTVGNITGDGNSFTVDTSTFTVGTGGEYFAYKKVRFDDTAARDAYPPFNGWKQGDKAWVDNSTYGIQGWTVYEYINNTWMPKRTEQPKVDSALMLQAKLYNKEKSTVYGDLEYYDPAKGFIPKQARNNLNFSSMYDPASYTDGDPLVYSITPSRAWGPEHVGQTWWDLNAVRYYDYEISDAAYRWQHWGEIAPNTSIDVYEWVQSPVLPTKWAEYVANGTSFNQFGVDYVPSGTVKNASNPAWTTSTTYTSAGTPITYYYFWVKNAYTIPFPQDRAVTTIEITNTISNPTAYGVSWYAAIDRRNIIVANVGTMLVGDNTVLSLLYTHKANEQVDFKEWDLVRENDPTSIPVDYYWTKLKNSLTGKDGLSNIVPDPYLSDLMRYGTLIRPRQSWFKDRTAAAAAYVTKANQLLLEVLLVPDSNRSTWVDYFYAAEPAPESDYTVATISSRDALGGNISDGSTVLVLGGADTANLWILYQYSFNNGNYLWTSIRVQEYNTPNYWSYVDWYMPASGITANTIPTYTVPDLASRVAYAGIQGVVVKVLNIGDGRWAMYRWENSTGIAGWITVAYQDGTIQISDGIYNGSINTMMWDTTPFDSLTFDIYPYIEFGYIIDGIRNAVFDDLDPHNTTGSAPLNNLFFTMINYVLVEQGFVDWIIKTSYIVLKGFNIPLSTSTLYTPDNTDSLIAYINEIKPYHAKIRDFVTSRTWQDNAYVHSTDFDNPANVSVSTNIAYSNIDWQNNYLTNPQLIRTLKTKLVFDRIASFPEGWDTKPWDAVGWQLESGALNPELISWGAWSRIQEYYAPGPNMIRKDDPNLITNSDYRGIIINGIGFSFRPGWDLAPWDSPMGWQADQRSFDNYLDLIIEGGVAPQYDYYFGTGTKTSFKLSRIPQDPASLVVWSDRNLRDYGVDWIIPTHVTSMLIVQGGESYNVGDKLELDLSPNNEPTCVTVTSVDINGSIQSVSIDTKGQYDIFTGTELPLVYRQYYYGSGTGAIVKPVWGGNSLVFKDAPSSNSTPNVYVLYVGTTFIEAPTGPIDIINDGNQFIQPFVAEDHAEELYTATIHESIRLDTYTDPVGGAPVVYMRVYELDGIRDQFDLGIRPMDTGSVIVQKDGLVLTYGLTNDYIINWETNRLVFLLPPTGTNLQIMTISAGGTGTGIYNPTVVNSGYGYATGDLITFAGGNTVNYDAATVQVTNVLATQLEIVSGGSGYSIGDVLILDDDFATAKTYALELEVASVTTNGTITSLVIKQPGEYQYTPLTNIWLTPSVGTGVDINVTWGIASISRVNPGLYSTHPTTPIQQLATTGNGVDATFASLYTFVRCQNVFTASGSENQFEIDYPVPNDDVSMLLATVDGVVSDYVTANGRTVTLIVTPPANSTVCITLFTSSDFSVVRDQSIYLQAGIYAYVINSVPYSTQPPYISTTVTLNGLELVAPYMDMFKANGYVSEYQATYMPVNTAYLQVWLNGYLLTENVEYTISGNIVTFNTAPAANSIIALVVTDPTYPHDYTIENNYIRIALSVPFVNGDELKIVTYSEDTSYKFRTQTFTGPKYPLFSGNEVGTYLLADTPWNDSSLLVWVNNEMQTLLYDYRYEVTDGIPGWDATPWDVYGWQAEYSGMGVIIFGGNIAHSPSDTVYVQYMSGSPQKVATAFRNTSTGGAFVNSIAINNSKTTELLSDMLAISNSIEIKDYTVLSLPTDYQPGIVWIGDERISYNSIEFAPTVQYPNRAFLTELRRGTLNTPSGNVSTLFNSIFYDGDNVTTYFATAEGTVPLGGPEVVYIGNDIQIDNAINTDIGTYSFVINPDGYPAGRYVKFDVAPPAGWRNVRLSAPTMESKITSIISHPINSVVLDGGYAVEIPGGYKWQPAPNGLQYNNTALANFLLENSGTRN